jgi:hypothetical protein
MCSVSYLLLASHVVKKIVVPSQAFASLASSRLIHRHTPRQ